MDGLKQELLQSGVSSELLAGWDDHAHEYSQPLLTEELLAEAMELIPMEPDAWQTVETVYRKCMTHGPYCRVLRHLHTLVANGLCPGFNSAMWETLRGYFAEDYPCLGAVLILSMIPGMKQLYAKMRIDNDVLKATLYDLAIWMRDYRRKQGHWGVTEMGWLVLHPAGRLFRLGRLQFMAGNCPFPVRLYDNGETAVLLQDPTEEATSGDGYRLVCTKGMPVVEIHIPEDGRMDIALCVQSLRQAIEFYQQHYPGHDSVFQLVTWFLDPQLDGLLPPESNIVRFQRLFHRFPVHFDEGDCLNRVFGTPTIDIATAPRDTSLRRAILEHMERGGHMGGGAGFLLFREVKDFSVAD